MKKKRAKEIKFERRQSNEWCLLTNVMSMFDYSFCPEHFRREFLEWSLLRLGFVAIAKKEDKYYVGYLAAYDHDEYGLPVGEADFSTRNGFTFPVTIGVDCVVGYNNDSRLPDLNLGQYAKWFTEIDTSIDMQVKKSRLCPIPMAKDEKIKNAMESILTDVEEGNTKIIGKPFSPAAIEAGDSKLVEMVSFTEPDQIAKVQYLSQLYDDILRRFWIAYGQPLSGMNKRAQVNSDELNGYETLAKIYPFAMLTARQELVEECNKVFGTDWKVDFSEAYQHLNKKEVIKNDTEGAVPEPETAGKTPDSE